MARVLCGATVVAFIFAFGAPETLPSQVLFHQVSGRGRTESRPPKSLKVSASGRSLHLSSGSIVNNPVKVEIDCPLNQRMECTRHIHYSSSKTCMDSCRIHPTTKAPASVTRFSVDVTRIAIVYRLGIWSSCLKGCWPSGHRPILQANYRNIAITAWNADSWDR